MERSARITTRSPSRLDLLWYRRLGVEPPWQVSSSGLGGLARLLPYRWRRFHRWFAFLSGYYWLPCPLCGREYGGHEHGERIPDQSRGEGYAVLICSECTRTRNHDVP